MVRFLAKRFLPEYEAGADKLYSRAVNIEEKLLNLTIEDKSAKVTKFIAHSLYSNLLF